MDQYNNINAQENYDYLLLNKIPQKLFEQIVLFLSAIAAAKLLF